MKRTLTSLTALMLGAALFTMLSCSVSQQNGLTGDPKQSAASQTSSADAGQTKADTPPEAPVLISPADGAVFKAGETVRFEWSCATPGVENSIFFDDPLPTNTQGNSFCEVMLPVSNQNINGPQHTWYAQAAINGISVKSDVRHYTVLIPPIPALVSPSVNAVIIAGTPVHFEWTADPDCTYCLYLDYGYEAVKIYEGKGNSFDTSFTWPQLGRIFGWKVKAFYIPNTYGSVSSRGLTLVQYILGDVNSDGIINNTDASMVAQYYVGLPVSGFNLTAADVDGNRIVDMVDALLIKQYVLGMITKFPASK